jgi:hypothetical protein
MLTFIILVASELCLLLRLLIPRVIAWGELRYQALDHETDGDWPFIPLLDVRFHDGDDTDA